MNEDFYIGYLPKMSESLARVVKTFILLASIAAIGSAVVFWFGQKPFAKSFFEYAAVKDFDGTIHARPLPFLLVEKGDQNNGLPTFEKFPLVGAGKHGFDAGNFDGARVRLKGTLIYRDDLRMIEIAPHVVQKIGETSSDFQEESGFLGQFTLRGEIVDSKCYLGVMNPGESKPHRDCAALCLRGGIPPLFIVKDAAGNVSQLWLISENGEAINQKILDFVAEPVEISGEATRTGDQLFFKIDPRQIKRLP